MGSITLRFEAGEAFGTKTTQLGRIGWGHTGQDAGTYPNTNSWSSRHAPLQFFKNGLPKGVMVGFNTDSGEDLAEAVFLGSGISTTKARFGQTSLFGNPGDGLEVGVDIPARFAIKVVDTTGSVVADLQTTDFNNKTIPIQIDDGSGGATASNKVGDFCPDSTQSIEGVGGISYISSHVLEALTGSYTASSNSFILDGTVYDITISGDFDRVDILDWRFLNNDGKRDWSENIGGSVNVVIAGVDTGDVYPQIRGVDGGNYNLDSFADFPDFFGSTADLGAVGNGVSFVGGTADKGYATRVYSTINEDGSVVTQDSTFSSLVSVNSGLDQGWGVYTQNSVSGIDPELYIFVNGNLRTDGDEDFSDGKAYLTGYNSISDIPAGDLDHNKLVYVVAGTTVNGSALTVDTVFAVNDGVVGSATPTAAINAATFTASSNFTEYSGGDSLSGVTLTGEGSFVDDTGLVSIPDLTTISITNAVATFSGAANRVGDIPNGTVGRLSFEESGGDNRHFTVDVTVSNVTDA